MGDRSAGFSLSARPSSPDIRPSPPPVAVSRDVDATDPWRGGLANPGIVDACDPCLEGLPMAIGGGGGSVDRCRTTPPVGRSGVAQGSRSGLGGVLGPIQLPPALDPSRTIPAADESDGAALFLVESRLGLGGGAWLARASLSASSDMIGMRAIPPGLRRSAAGEWPNAHWTGLLIVGRESRAQKCVSEKMGADDVSSRAGAPRCTHAWPAACAAVIRIPGAGASSLLTRSFASPDTSRQNIFENSRSSRAGAALRASTAFDPNSPSKRWYPPSMMKSVTPRLNMSTGGRRDASEASPPGSR